VLWGSMSHTCTRHASRAVRDVRWILSALGLYSGVCWMFWCSLGIIWLFCRWFGCIVSNFIYFGGDSLMLGRGFMWAWQGFFVDFGGGPGPRTRGFVWASKREPEKWHTETRSNLGIFCLARFPEAFR